MTVCTLDYETRSRIDIRAVGSYRYVDDPSTIVLCAGYTVDNGEVQVWTPDHDDRDIKHVFRHSDLIVAHNANFERIVTNNLAVPRFGWPKPRLEQWRCTMAMAMASGLPGRLELVARILKLEHQKDIVGERMMLRVSKPRKACKGEDPNGVYWHDDAEQYLQPLYEYCKQDVRATREIYESLWQLSDLEQEVWFLDQRINDRGMYLDRDLAIAARKITEEAYEAFDKEISEVTNGIVTAVTQVGRLKEWINSRGCSTDTLDKKDLIKLLDETSDLQPDVKHALGLRQLGAQAAVKKIDAFLLHQQQDQRLRGAFTYHAAGTGRWASRGVQVHNLKRLTEESDAVLNDTINAIASGSFRHLNQKFSNPLQVIGDHIRVFIKAAPGNVLMGADFSGIEARVLAWLAGEKSKLEVFRKFDRGEGPDPYVVTATRFFSKPAEQITKTERQIGKGGELAWGFGGSIPAFKRFVPDTPYTDHEIAKFHRTWCQQHPHIKRFWQDLYNEIYNVLETPGKCARCGPIYLETDNMPFLWVRLPSGRCLAYPEARLVDEHFTGRVVDQTIVKDGFTGRQMITFKDNVRGWNDVGRVWFGVFVENVVQAIARDLLAEAMLRVEAAGLPICVHVHDEVVVEVPAAEAEQLKPKFTALMTALPAWAEGLPVVAKAWVSERYTK